MILKTVTLQEANGLLPLVREHFCRIHVLLAHLQQLRARLEKKMSQRYRIDPSREAIVIKRRRGRNVKASVKEIRSVEELIEREISDVMRLGAVIKGLVPPHIDFLSIRNNEPIFLCWHGGDAEISHWHQLDDGSPLRHVIAKKQFFGPHVVH